MLWPEKDIFDGIRKGDRKIFDLVFKEYYSGLCTFATDYVRNHDTAREIVQEVFFNLWENHHKIYINSSLKAYLYRSVHNLCVNFLRNSSQFARNNIQLEQVKQQADLLFIEMPDDIFEAAFTEQLEQKLDKAIENLPEQCRIVFCASRYENLSYPEIAEKLNISLSTVKTQMSRAMDKLREIVDNYLKDR